MKIDVNGYNIEGTPEEMGQLLRILQPDKKAQKASEKDGGGSGAPVKQKETTEKKVDWAKAAALRKAGWSYDKIGEELGVSGVTVSAHLNKK